MAPGDPDLGGEAPCYAHLLEEGAPAPDPEAEDGQRPAAPAQVADAGPAARHLDPAAP